MASGCYLGVEIEQKRLAMILRGPSNVFVEVLILILMGVEVR
jgi:hypothetical protein